MACPRHVGCQPLDGNVLNVSGALPGNVLHVSGALPEMQKNSTTKCDRCQPWVEKAFQKGMRKTCMVSTLEKKNVPKLCVQDGLGVNKRANQKMQEGMFNLCLVLTLGRKKVPKRHVQYMSDVNCEAKYNSTTPCSRCAPALLELNEIPRGHVQHRFGVKVEALM